MSRLSNKSAIVTGGGAGIGEATCIRFAEEGAEVAIFDLHPDVGQQVVAEIESKGERAAFFKVDVSDETEVQRGVKSVLDSFGKIEKQGCSVSVVDLRWLAPLDDAVLLDIVQTSGGKVLIVHEAVQRGGYGAEIAMHIRELCGPGANLSVHRLATPSVRIPASPVLRAALLPNSDSIARAVRGLLNAD